MTLRVEKTSTVIVDFDRSKNETENTKVIAKCDGPRCNKPDSSCAGIIVWEGGNPESVPDAAFRITTVADFNGQMWSFFSKRCLADFMLEYSMPLSPREQTAIALANKTAEEKIDGAAKGSASVSVPDVAVDCVVCDAPNGEALTPVSPNESPESGGIVSAGS